MAAANAKTLNMTEGKPLPLILKFCLPILLGNLMQQFYNMVDTAVVGKFVGTGALAAVGATGSILFMVIGFVEGMCSGLCIPISQAFGAGDEKLLRRCLAHAVYLAVFFAIALTLVTSLGMRWLLTVMNTPADIMADSATYLRIIFLGIPATIFYNLTASLLRALGNSRTPLMFLIFASCMNIVLDLVLVLVFHLDVMGVGLATVISQFSAALGCFLYIKKNYPLLRLTSESMKPDFRIGFRLLMSGLPMALQYSITAIGSMLIQVSINNLGSLSVASVTAALKVSNFAVLPYTTLGNAMATWCGQNMGARNANRIDEGVRCGMKISVVYSIVMGVLLYFLGQFVTLIFLDGTDPNLPQLMSLARHFLRGNCTFYLFLGTLSVYRFALQGLEYGPLAMVAGIFEMVARSAVALLLAPSFGLDIIRFASPIAWIAACVLLVPAYLTVMPKVRQRLTEPTQK